MKLVKVLKESFNTYILEKVKVGDLVEVYELKDLESFPNIRESVLENVRMHSKRKGFIGFVKEECYTDNLPLFMSVFSNECEEVYENKDNECECYKCELKGTCQYVDKYQRLPRVYPGALGLCKKLRS